MSILNNAMKDKHFDVRLMERNLNKGLMLEEEAEKQAKTIKDDTANATSMDLEAALAEAQSQNKLRKMLHN